MFPKIIKRIKQLKELANKVEVSYEYIVDDDEDGDGEKTARPLLRFAALLLWMMFFLANLSNIAATLGISASAASLSVVLRNALIALRVVFA